MGFGSIWPWLVVLAIVLILFGRGRISGLMGDIGQGMKTFRSGLADDDEKKDEARPVENATAEPVAARKEEERSKTS